MSLQKSIFVAAALAFATAALAEEVAETKIQISIDDGDGNAAIHLNLDSESTGFNMHEMQLGETQSIVDESGRAILITREENGYQLDIAGETVHLPLIDGDQEAMWVEDIDMGGADVEVHVIAGDDFTGAGMPAGVMIISEKAIDDVTQETIRALLESSGHDAGVEFLNGGDMGGGLHKTVIIKKEIVSTR